MALLALAPLNALAQGVTSAGLTGIVKDAQGGVVPGTTIVAVHQPSGTTYSAVSQADGRYTIAGMRVGGPYTITAELPGFVTEERTNVTLNLGVTQDVDFNLRVAAVAETVQVIGESNPIFSSGRTGAATAVTREDLATLPTVSGRITDITRLTPQYGGSGTFAGQDNRANNITVDGSYFNNSFGLGVTTGGIGDRTGVAPISLEAIEQVQVSVAPYDVRQGNFTGAGVNTVTRSGTNQYTGSFYYRTRNESYVGTEAAGQAFNPGTFDTNTAGGWLGGPIVRNKLFIFGAYERQEDKRPLSTFRANRGNEPIAGNVTRVLASDLTSLSSFLQQNFDYDTGPFDDIPDKTPGKPWMIKADYNLNSTNKITFRYNQLDSSSDSPQSGSSSLGTSRPTFSTNFLTYQNSNYKLLENLKSGVGEWNSSFATFTNNLIVGYTFQDESRDQLSKLFPFVVIGDGAGSAITSFGSEPFTPFNLLSYKTFQAQDSITKYTANHSWTLGGSLEKFHSDNSFYFGVQSAYSYNTLADFYTDAAGYLANPNRTTSPVSLNIFQVRYLLQPGQTQPPLQKLDVYYAGGYLQDEWRPRTNLTIIGGVRMDVPKFSNTAFPNPAADALTFRDQNGSPVQYSTGSLPDAKPYWSPRLGLNWDVLGDQSTQVRGGTGVFTGKPPYVWISNQIGNTGVLSGFLDSRNTTAFPFTPDPDRYKPAPTGAAATSYELDVTDQNFRFPQTWRTSIGVDRRLPGGLIGTTDFIFNQDINAPVYLNANLPGAQSAFTGADSRPRWVATSAFPACAGSGQAGPCVTRLNNAPGNQITAAYVIKSQSKNKSWNYAASLTKTMTRGFSAKAGFGYGVSKSLVEPSSTAGSSWGSANPIRFDPNNPDLAYSANSPGKRWFLQTTYTKQYFGFGATTVSMYYDAHTNGNTSYTISGDANGDTVSNNDLIYIPRSTSEMNFATFTTGGRTFTAADQAAAFEAYIQQDDYLRKHRGEYAKRGAVFLPVVQRLDLSLIQDLFKSVGGKRHSGQIRLDITNFGNLLNSDWGVGQRLINNQVLTNPGVDASGAMTYRMRVVNGELMKKSLQTNAGIADVYVMMLSFRYMFN
ncbi:MAG: carboxypeptidase regulatory-like domain-containing protein [Vicinamibacterales bacterium]